MTIAELPLVPVPAAPAGQPPGTITVERYAGPCGAVIGGVDLADDVPDATIAEIRRALLDHGVVFFRGQSLTPEQQVAFSRRFGPFSPVPFVQPIAEHDEVIAVVRDAVRGAGVRVRRDLALGLLDPPRATHGLDPPRARGPALRRRHASGPTSTSRSRRSPPGSGRRCARLTGVHSARDAYSPKMQAIHDQFVGMTVQTSEDANRLQQHPAVRVHAETGREALYLNPQYTIGLDGWWPHEARALLDYVHQHATQAAFTCRWRWSAGDVAFWDNRCLQHMVMGDVSGHRRAMHRTTVAGEAPIPPG